MKHGIITGIVLYQKIVSPLLKQLFGIGAMCRFSPSCSAYAKRAIEKEGVIKGSVLAGKRLLRCQPFWS